jgi:hypothetical protein
MIELLKRGDQYRNYDTLARIFAFLTSELTSCIFAQRFGAASRQWIGPMCRRRRSACARRPLGHARPQLDEAAKLASTDCKIEE